MAGFVRIGAWLMAGLVALALLALLVGWMWMRASLPLLDGPLVLPGLQGEAQVERDADGTVTISAGSESDAMRVLGFVHAQERYFEMDLMRRSAAGELAALVGAPALPVDRRVRVHRMRARVEHLYAQASAHERELLEAYAEGANSGLDALRARPWAYGLLRTRPEPWRPEDALLVGYAMFFDLQDSDNRREWSLLQARRHLGADALELLTRDGSHWDAPLQGTERELLDVARVVDLLGPVHALHAAGEARLADDEDPPVKGSNNFAVAGTLTRDGRALVADDMHLGLRAPNIWFRAQLRYPAADAPGGQVDVGGVTLPGLPGVVVGSTGHVAWGFTNSYGDYHDFVRVHWVDREAGRYRVPGGEDGVTRHREELAVLGGAPEVLEVVETRWGPVLHDDLDDTSLALAWTAHRAGSLDLGLLRMTRAADLDAALDIANRAGVPVQNAVIGDRSGRIGWTLMGRLPRRVGDCDPLQALDPVMDGCDWDGWLEPDEVPRILDPGSARLWTANSRVVDGVDLPRVGDGGYDLGARQRQIRDALLARDVFEEADLLAIQLDHRAVFLETWWQLLRELIAEAGPGHLGLQALEPATRHWEGEARAYAVAYPLVRAFRAEVIRLVLDTILAPVREAEGEDFLPPRVPQAEAFVWPLASIRPEAWVPSGHASWLEAFDAAALKVAEEAGGSGAVGTRSWGERNTARIRHPLAGALPAPLARRLSMPAQPLPGDSHLPRAQGPSFGASQRMVVAPGHEEHGVLHMPGGQSGHPLSPFWGSGHEEWVQGRASPFLPGEPKHRLVLSPAANL
ncbi:penicillin acylase family protein [Alkalisalibacterium limincola]|uniref:Penicillin acylase family protein n=1 Tax=Alkalisalibacterium limincola TaxID=2699169 RepID=A0A5C8KRR0_9GAMM|nr:penicillin acylase family protein [Alkalisalibacterium limincola]TXK62145.1 penicillin acylase family protein [Alkalisalibacterium limincola]